MLIILRNIFLLHEVLGYVSYRLISALEAILATRFQKGLGYHPTEANFTKRISEEVKHSQNFVEFLSKFLEISIRFY